MSQMRLIVPFENEKKKINVQIVYSFPKLKVFFIFNLTVNYIISVVYIRTFLMVLRPKSQPPPYKWSEVCHVVMCVVGYENQKLPTYSSTSKIVMGWVLPKIWVFKS